MRASRTIISALTAVATAVLLSAPCSLAQKRTAAKPKGKAPAETSAQMRKRQQATQQEIKATRQKIAVNDKSVSQGLADLNRIEADIQSTQKRVSDLSAQAASLDKRISSLESGIRRGEQELAKLRADYLRAVKKMRLAKGSSSTLSFIFSSKSFHQAARRIRYIRQFNAWRERQTEKIRKKTDMLKAQNLQLANTRTEKRKSLAAQQQARQTLKGQYARQDALVVQLKRQGDELRAHLAKKQAEANELKNSISALIAAEQQRKQAEQKRLEEERQRKAEQARIAEQKRLEREREEQRRADLAAAQAPQPARERKPAQPAKKAEKPKKQEKAQKPEKQPKPQAPAPEKKRSDSGRTYADARGRRPRNQSPAPSGGESSSSSKAKSASQTASSTPVKASPSSGGFEASKGSLPRPVTGSFRVTSPFGRHTMPELPGVTYDNPGIDAEVSAGASAIAVYPGRVSGIYRLPGYNTVVIVCHGNYYTVYGNLATTSVKSGDNVKQGQTLGKVAVSDDGSRPSFHFEVWRNRDKLNPTEWIR